MKTLSLHMQTNNGVFTNMGIVYVTPVQNKAGIHLMGNLSDHEVQCHNNKNSYALIRSSTEHKLFMYLTSSIIIKRHKHQIFWDQLARRAANNLLIKYKYSPYKHHT
jgi:hypothetical protein